MRLARMMPAGVAIAVAAVVTAAASHAATAGAAVAAAAPAAPVAPTSSLTQVALVLVLVVGLIAGVAWLLRRLGMVRNTSGGAVRIVSGVSVGNRERILVVEVADQWIVVGVSPAGIHPLSTMPRQETPTDAGAGLPPPPGKQFALWLKQTIERRNAAANGPAAPGSDQGH